MLNAKTKPANGDTKEKLDEALAELERLAERERTLRSDHAERSREFDQDLAAAVAKGDLVTMKRARVIKAEMTDLIIEADAIAVVVKRIQASVPELERALREELAAEARAQQQRAVAEFREKGLAAAAECFAAVTRAMDAAERLWTAYQQLLAPNLAESGAEGARRAIVEIHDSEMAKLIEKYGSMNLIPRGTFEQLLRQDGMARFASWPRFATTGETGHA